MAAVASQDRAREAAAPAAALTRLRPAAFAAYKGRVGGRQQVGAVRGVLRVHGDPEARGHRYRGVGVADRPDDLLGHLDRGGPAGTRQHDGELLAPYRAASPRSPTPAAMHRAATRSTS